MKRNALVDIGWLEGAVTIGYLWGRHEGTAGKNSALLP